MNYGEFNSLPQLSYAQQESINSLATNLSYCGSNVRIIMITSRTAQEGKSFISLNLLRTFASLGKRVVLLDTDLRRSAIKIRYQFNSTENNGLTQYLAGLCEAEDIVYSTNIPNAYYIPSGRNVENSLQLLATPQLEDLIKILDANFDIVLVDTAPAGAISDALEIAKHCDGSLIVVGYNIGHKKEIVDLADSIQRTGCPVLGVALNQVQVNSIASRGTYYGYSKYSSYYYYKRDEEKPKKKRKL